MPSSTGTTVNVSEPFGVPVRPSPKVYVGNNQLAPEIAPLFALFVLSNNVAPKPSLNPQ